MMTHAVSEPIAFDVAGAEELARDVAAAASDRAIARAQLLAAARAEMAKAFDRLRAAAPHLSFAVEPTPAASPVAALDRAVARVHAKRSRYEAVAAALSCPWTVVGALHALADFRFDQRLSVTGPSPSGADDPAFSWEGSAVDALRQAGLDRHAGWTDALQRGEVARLSAGASAEMSPPDVLGRLLKEAA